MEARCLIVISCRSNTSTDLYWAPDALITERILGSLCKYNDASELADQIEIRACGGGSGYGQVDHVLHDLYDNIHEVDSLSYGEVLNLKDYQRMIYLPGDGI